MPTARFNLWEINYLAETFGYDIVLDGDAMMAKVFINDAFLYLLAIGD